MSDSAPVRCPVAPGDIVAGKYKVERVLGSGGMGVVVAARHLDLDQPVALKFILPAALSGKGNVERFMREARAAVRLKSEHVARVYDVGRDGEDRPYMVLELLEGLDLSKLSKQKGPLPVADSVEYVLQACEALVEAHAAGIVHRDLKPQNLFVTRRLNGTPLVKVLDFGIAKAFGPGAVGQMALTDSAAIIGSPLYMAPEQMRSARTAEVRSDIWALGVILYELLGGQLPFDGETVTEVCIRVVNEEPEALLSLRPGLDPALVTIVMRCLEKEPDDRYHNVSALAAALEPFSRSAKQGGPVRPWRSFEDTQDSQEGGKVAAGKPAPTNPDATGPATAIVLQSLEERSRFGTASGDEDEDAIMSTDERRARLLAGSTKASPGGARAGAPRSKKARGDDGALVSTDVTWGESTSDPPGSARAKRSFSTGMVAGIVVAVAAAAVVLGLFLGRGSTAAGGAASASGAAGTSGGTAAGAAGAAGNAPAIAPATPSPVAVPASESTNPLPAVGAATPPGTRVVTPATSASVAARLMSASKVKGASRAPVEKAPVEKAPVEPAAPVRPAEPKPSDPVSPNGAPILH